MDSNRMPDFEMDNDSDYQSWIEECMMACNLPAMVYCNPNADEEVELDFGELKQLSVRRKTRLKKVDEESFSKWDCLPDLLLEDVFQRLTIKERYMASQVCRNWNRIFHSRRVWNTFVLHDRTLTRRKFNYYLGDQYVLDHHRTQLCLHKVSRGFRRIIIKPMENFFNLYEFMTSLSYYCENYESLNLIRTLDFTFGCDLVTETNREIDYKVFGTGGKLLQALKKMMDNLIGLKHLSLQNLLLEKEEAEYLLDDVAYNCCETLRTLRLVNCSKHPFAMLHPVVFINLHTLTLSPQHLSDDIVALLGNTLLKDLNLVQTKMTPHVNSVSFKSWKECRKCSPRLRVHHILEEEAKTQDATRTNKTLIDRFCSLELIKTRLSLRVRQPYSDELQKAKPVKQRLFGVVWQEGAPVQSVIYYTPEKEISVSSIFTASNMYCNTLEVLAYPGLPEYSLQDAFEERADTSLILLSKCCPYLETLVVRDQVSTATLILLARQSRNLRRLIIRKFAIIKKCDWPHNPEWTDSFYNWLKQTASSYEKTREEISRILDFKWSPLTDEEFKSFPL